MHHQYYDPDNLQRLRVTVPLLYGQLEKLLPQVHTCWQSLVSVPSPLPETMIPNILNLIDLVDEFTTLCKRIRIEFHTKTSRSFFKRIDDFNRRKIQLQIALARYDDLFMR